MLPSTRFKDAEGWLFASAFAADVNASQLAVSRLLQDQKNARFCSESQEEVVLLASIKTFSEACWEVGGWISGWILLHTAAFEIAVGVGVGAGPPGVGVGTASPPASAATSVSLSTTP